MYGPNFLLFFAVVAVAAMIVCRIYLNSLEPAAAPPLIPQVPDPYEIAYLRGGENEVIRAATVSLLQFGLLSMEEPGTGKSKSKGTKIGWSKNHQPTQNLSPIEHAVYLACHSDKLPSELFTPALQAQIGGLCAGYKENLTARSLLFRPEALRAGKRVVAWTALGVIVLGIYKLMAAYDSGHRNIAFLVIEMIVAVIAFSFVGSKGRMTAAGKRYVLSLQQAYSGLRRPGATAQSSYDIDPVLLMTAVFGVAALSTTPHRAYGAMFQQSGATSSSGCGSSSSCGSSDGGGSSCGGSGGCGGCGGGGGGD